MSAKQRTLTVGADRIRIVVRRQTYMGNFLGGHSVRIKRFASPGRNEQSVKYHINAKTTQEAMDKGYARFVQEHC